MKENIIVMQPEVKDNLEKTYRRKLDKWWESEGLGIVRNVKVLDNNGVEVEFILMIGFATDDLPQGFYEPFVKREGEQTKVQYLTEKEFDLDVKRYYALLLDNENNRTHLEELIQTTFASAVIHSWENEWISRDNLNNRVLALRKVTVLIEKESDIEQLQASYRTFAIY